jgi:hypothetical protein
MRGECQPTGARYLTHGSRAKSWEPGKHGIALFCRLRGRRKKVSHTGVA